MTRYKVNYTVEGIRFLEPAFKIVPANSEEEAHLRAFVEIRKHHSGNIRIGKICLTT